MSHAQQHTRMREEAAAWAIALEQPLSEAQRRRLQQWLEADARHADTLAVARRTWQQLAGVSLGTAASGQVVPLRSRRRPVRWLAAAGVALLLVGVGLLQGPQWLLPLRADFHTAQGEIRSVTLPDGTVAILDSGSGLRLAFTKQERRVELLAGSAIFETRAQDTDEPRPFTVQSAGGKARALGTRFVVSRENPRQGWVGVMEHRVAVVVGAESRVLGPGDALHYRNGHFDPQAINLSQATSWEQGLLVFDRVPLAEVVSALNRYHRGHLVIANPTLSRRQVSGVFQLSSLDDGLAMLAAELSAQRLELARLSVFY